MLISDANLTEDFEEVEPESDTFLTPFVTTGTVLIIPLVGGDGLSFSGGDLVSSCRISTLAPALSPGLDAELRVSVLSSSLSSAGGSELKLDAGLLACLAGLAEEILDMAEAGLDLRTKCWSVSPAARLTAEAGLCLKRSLMLA